MPTSRPGLQRSQEQRILAGVCGGLAEWLGWSATLVRLLFFAVSVLSAAFPGILVYIILWVLMPNRPPAHPGGPGVPAAPTPPHNPGD